MLLQDTNRLTNSSLECWALKSCCLPNANLMVDFGSRKEQLEPIFGYFNDKDYFKPKSGRGRMCKYLGNITEIVQRTRLNGLTRSFNIQRIFFRPAHPFVQRQQRSKPIQRHNANSACFQPPNKSHLLNTGSTPDSSGQSGRSCWRDNCGVPFICRHCLPWHWWIAEKLTLHAFH